MFRPDPRDLVSDVFRSHNVTARECFISFIRFLEKYSRTVTSGDKLELYPRADRQHDPGHPQTPGCQAEGSLPNLGDGVAVCHRARKGQGNLLTREIAPRPANPWDHADPDAAGRKIGHGHVRGLGFDSWTDGISCRSPAHRRVRPVLKSAARLALVRLLDSSPAHFDYQRP